MKNCSIDDVSKIDIKMFIAELQEQELKARTINHYIMNLRSLFKFLVKEEYIEEKRNPMTTIKLLKQTKDVIKTYKQDDVKSLISYWNGKDYVSVRNKTMLMLLIATGIRASELCSLKTGDIYEDSIKVLGKGDKVRFVPIPLELKRQFLRYERVRELYIKPNEELYFVNKSKKPVTRHALIDMISKTGVNMGLKINCTAHHFRRYYAQQMLKVTDLYTVSRLLGHTDIKTTQIYIQSIEDTEIIARGMNSPLSNL
jgi:integrase/recombinase XerD